MRKKFKLLTSFLALIMIISVMSFGVWASVQTSVEITTSLSFSATGLRGELWVNIEGSYTGAKITSTGASDILLSNNGTLTHNSKTYVKVLTWDYGTGADLVSPQLQFSFVDMNGGEENGQATDEVVNVNFYIKNTGTNACDSSVEAFYGTSGTHQTTYLSATTTRVSGTAQISANTGFAVYQVSFSPRENVSFTDSGFQIDITLTKSAS